MPEHIDCNGGGQEHNDAIALERFLEKTCSTLQEVGEHATWYTGNYVELSNEMQWSRQRLGLAHQHMVNARQKGKRCTWMVPGPAPSDRGGRLYVAPERLDYLTEKVELKAYVLKGAITQGKQIIGWIEGLAGRLEACALSARNVGDYDAWRHFQNHAESLIRTGHTIQAANADLLAYLS